MLGPDRLELCKEDQEMKGLISLSNIALVLCLLIAGCAPRADPEKPVEAELPVEVEMLDHIRYLRAGDAAEFKLTIGDPSGSTLQPIVEISGLPSGVSATVKHISEQPESGWLYDRWWATITVQTAANTLTGWHKFAVKATTGGGPASTSATVVVATNPAGVVTAVRTDASNPASTKIVFSAVGALDEAVFIGPKDDQTLQNVGAGLFSFTFNQEDLPVGFEDGGSRLRSGGTRSLLLLARKAQTWYIVVVKAEVRLKTNTYKAFRFIRWVGPSPLAATLGGGYDIEITEEYQILEYSIPFSGKTVYAGATVVEFRNVQTQVGPITGLSVQHEYKDATGGGKLSTVFGRARRQYITNGATTLRESYAKGWLEPPPGGAVRAGTTVQFIAEDPSTGPGTVSSFPCLEQTELK
jgi:hypothetical protein